MQKTLALIVDDEPDLIELVSLALQQMDVDSIGASTLKEAQEKLKAKQFNFCLTDMNLPDGDGLDLVKEIRLHYPSVPVAVITAFGNMDKAVESLKAGAFDYVAKPLDIDILRKMVRQAANLNSAITQDLGQKADLKNAMLDRQLIGDSYLMTELKDKVRKVAQSQAPIFIQGESGTGKEVVARCIHELSSRKEGPFIAVNCGAIPSELIESELFGHMKGSFSGAIRDKIGLFEAADGGTLFLDEVADLPVQMQVKLLRVIQEKRIRAIGDTREKSVDCRLLSATHKNLESLIKTNQFRGDLYYRINVIQIATPPLRERGNDVIIIAENILSNLTKNASEIKQLSGASRALLKKHPFPGNVRELQNALQRACALCEDTLIEPSHLQLEASDTTAQAPTSLISLDTKPHSPLGTGSDSSALPTYDPTEWASLEDYLAEIEIQAIKSTLDSTHWNRTAAAKILGMSFRSLRYRLKKLGIDE